MRTRVLTLSLIVMFVIVPLFGTPNTVLSKEKPIELSYSNFLPAGYGTTKALEAWAKEIEKRTDGKVKITFYHGGTLTDAVNCYEGVVKGISDIGQSCLAYNKGRFPLMEVVDLPGYSFNAIVPCLVSDEIYRRFMPKELSDTHILYIHTHFPGVIFTRDKPVRRLEDLKGLRIRSTGLSSKIVEAFGATPVAMPKGDQYDAMYKGVVDGTTGGVNELKGWRVAEVAKYSIAWPRVGYVTAFFVAMNLGKWRSLPPDVQKVFTDVSKEWPEYHGKTWNSMEVEGYQFGKEKGHQIIYLSPEEGARWEKAVKPLFDDHVKAMEAKGLPGRDALSYRNQLIEKYSKIYPEIRFE
jgi:TRAP-type C4-dicarboxylate transport system substrate-binding protein